MGGFVAASPMLVSTLLLLGCQSRYDVETENYHDQHQSGGPGLSMPVGIGRLGILKYLNRQACHRTIDIEVPKPAASRRKQQWSRFTEGA